MPLAAQSPKPRNPTIALNGKLRAAGSKDIVQQLLAAGADPTIAAMGGATPLHAAAEAGQLETVLLLLQVDLCTLSHAMTGGSVTTT